MYSIVQPHRVYMGVVAIATGGVLPAAPWSTGSKKQMTPCFGFLVPIEPHPLQEISMETIANMPWLPVAWYNKLCGVWGDGNDIRRVKEKEEQKVKCVTLPLCATESKLLHQTEAVYSLWVLWQLCAGVWEEANAGNFWSLLCASLVCCEAEGRFLLQFLTWDLVEK